MYVIVPQNTEKEHNKIISEYGYSEILYSVQEESECDFTNRKALTFKDFNEKLDNDISRFTSEECARMWLSMFIEEKNKEKFNSEQKRINDLSEHYVNKWIDEQKFPKTENDLKDYTNYVLSCVKIKYDVGDKI